MNSQSLSRRAKSVPRTTQTYLQLSCISLDWMLLSLFARYISAAAATAPAASWNHSFMVALRWISPLWPTRSSGSTTFRPVDMYLWKVERIQAAWKYSLTLLCLVPKTFICYESSLENMKNKIFLNIISFWNCLYANSTCFAHEFKNHSCIQSNRNDVKIRIK